MKHRDRRQRTEISYKVTVVKAGHQGVVSAVTDLPEPGPLLLVWATQGRDDAEGHHGERIFKTWKNVHSHTNL